MKTRVMMSVCHPLFWALVAFASPASAQTVGQLIPHKVKLESVDYLGKRAVKITEDGQVANGEAYAVVKDAVFHNGAIEVELAGRPAAGAAGGARGFIGIAFRLQNGQFEYIYLRPTNGRADDQVRRNHSTQYSAHPDFSFAVSRQQAPEKYESYVDLEPGVVDPLPHHGRRDEGPPVCPRRRPALSDRERSQTR